jgi:hypothetical protein
MSNKNIKKGLLTFIESNINAENPTVNLSEIVSSADYRSENEMVLEALISLIIEGRTHIITKKRMKEELFFSLVADSSDSRKMENRGSIEKLIAIVELYSKMTKNDDLKDFHKLTGNYFRKLAVLEFLERCSTDLGDLRILCRYLTGFFADEGPITIMDLGLSKWQIVDLLDKYHKGNFVLHNQGLVEIIKERGGIYLNAMLSSRLVDLLMGECIPLLTLDEKKGKGLYFEIKHTNIKERCLYYNDDEKELFRISSALLSKETDQHDKNISLLLYGQPGTGKTEFAYQLARNVGADIMQLNFSEIQSKWIGETEKNIRQIFMQYDKKRKTSNHPIILLINEADGLMNKRVAVNVSNDAFHNHAQTQLLELLEDFKGIVIVTTNLYQNIDMAFHRRFLFRKEITMPNSQTRELILRNSFVSQFLSEEVFQRIIESEWSPAQIRNIEQKINQLSTIQTIDEKLIESLLIQDEVLNKKGRLGFTQKRNSSIKSNRIENSLF